MVISQNLFTGLFRTLVQIDFFGEGPPVVPWGGQPTRQAVGDAIQAAADALPLTFREGYVEPLSNRLGGVLAVHDPTLTETLAGAVYDHAPHSQVTPELRRFLAVISNLYRSFLSSKRRTRAQFPLAEQLPPLATFKHRGDDGPFTYPVDVVRSLCGATVGVVSLPSTYRTHPVLWASLAHETGGHDVLHADQGLLPELAAGVRALFGDGPVQPRAGRLSRNQFLGLLWSHWIDEAASDVYGVLNIGPTFGLNLAAFFAALIARLERTQVPRLGTQSGDDQDGRLDPHPTDILRLHLILGATESLRGLSTAARQGYATDLKNLAGICAGGADTVTIQGHLPAGPGLAVKTTLPLSDMQEAARKVGTYIATAKLRALGGHNVQELETWDDADESAARHIATTLKANAPVASLGDDAQLLAGATLAAFDKPDSYEAITVRLDEALDLSFARDPFWGSPRPHPVFIRPRFLEPGSPELRLYLAVDAPAKTPTAKRPVAAKERVKRRTARG